MTSHEKEIRLQRHARIRRVKQLLRWLPRKANLERYPILKWFAKAARKRPFLWSFKVSQCTPAFYAGAIIAFLPLYGIQLPLAFGAAVLLRANLPITCGLQLITNPVTLLPVWFVTNKVGRWVIEFVGYGEGLTRVSTDFNALIIGGIIVGAVAGAVLDLLYRVGAHEARKFNLVPLEKALAAAKSSSPAEKAKDEGTLASRRVP